MRTRVWTCSPTALPLDQQPISTFEDCAGSVSEEGELVITGEGERVRAIYAPGTWAKVEVEA